MTLLLTIIAAVCVTLIWYISPKARELKIGVLLYMFWGASLMWFVDAAVAYLEDGAAFFAPTSQEMLNDAFLGFSVIALAAVVWIIVMLCSDPKHTIQQILLQKHKTNESVK